MVIAQPPLEPVMDAASLVLVATLAATAGAGPAATTTNRVTAPHGGIPRWAGPAATEYGIYGKRHPAIDAACYYPADIRTRPGSYEIAL
jgi:hypothetical protein